jgi:hypothetical protein
LSVRGFCAAEGISEPSFYAWRKRLRTRNVNGTRAFETNDAATRGCRQRQLVHSLQLLDTAGTLEIVHPLGYRIQVTGDVNPVALRHVIETLDERAAR